MRRIVIIIFTCILSFNYLLANEAELWDKANAYYQNKEYQKAIDTYDSLLQNNFESFDLYYNLGNAYYKKEAYPEAILYYEKAKKINPNDEDLLANLALANQHIIDKIEEIPPFFLRAIWEKTALLWSEKQWTVLNITFWGFFILFFILYLRQNRGAKKKLNFWIGLSFLILSILSGSLGYTRLHNQQQKKHAIVMEATVNIKSEPQEDGGNIFVIHQGCKIKIMMELKSWSKVQLSNGSKGWIENSAFEKI